jgi:uncharacterized membrane protein HdeD (DUF308 family)
MVLFLLIGIIDLLAGGIIVFSEELILSEVAKYVGIALIIKGIWTIITSKG